jgi:hypothetical protein
MNRPGFHTSEFKVALTAALLNLVNTWQGWVSWRDALIPTLSAVGYVVSRGFAKTEPRP